MAVAFGALVESIFLVTGPNSLKAAIMEGYNAYMESGTKYVTSDGKVLIIDPNWTPEEEAELLAGRTPEGRTHTAAMKHLSRMRASGRIPSPEPSRSLTKQEIDEYDLTRDPPEWTVAKYGSRTAAKKYCDRALYHRNKALRAAAAPGDVAPDSGLRFARWTIPQYVELLSTGNCHDKTRGQVVSAKKRIRRFIDSHPEMDSLSSEQVAEAYDKYAYASQHHVDKWKDDVVAYDDEPSLKYPGANSMIAINGDVPAGFTSREAAQRRKEAARTAAVRSIRAGMKDSSYVPGMQEIDDYVKSHSLDRGNNMRTRLTVEEMSRIAADPSYRPSDVPVERINEIREQMKRQGVQSCDLAYGTKHAERRNRMTLADMA